ncbi:MAG: hypothetical protein WD872_17500 [Pirellulaceae bacterium]
MKFHLRLRQNVLALFSIPRSRRGSHPQATRVRRLVIEAFEQRIALTSSPWHNPFDEFDLNFDRHMTRADEFAVGIFLAANGNEPIRVPPSPNPDPSVVIYYDITGDGWVSQADLEAILDQIAQQPADLFAAEGEDPELPVVALSGGDTLTEGGSHYVYISRFGGDISTALTVTLDSYGTGVLPMGHGINPADTDDYVRPATVTFQPYETGTIFEVSIVQDTRVEQNEKFVVRIAEGASYSIEWESYRAEFKILDDEWRWIKPDGPEEDGWYEWRDENGEAIVVTVDRTLYPDGSLSPSGYIHTPGWNSVKATMSASLVFPGFPSPWYYNVSLEAIFAFAGDSQTGQIWMSGSESQPPTGTAADGGYLSGAIGYVWAIDDDTGTNLHTVSVHPTFGVIAGGTYGWTSSGGGSSKGASGSFSISTSESWKEEQLGGKSVTLLFQKGAVE